MYLSLKHKNINSNRKKNCHTGISLDNYLYFLEKVKIKHNIHSNFNILTVRRVLNRTKTSSVASAFDGMALGEDEHFPFLSELFHLNF